MNFFDYYMSLSAKDEYMLLFILRSLLYYCTIYSICFMIINLWLLITHPLIAGREHTANHSHNIERQETHNIAVIVSRYYKVWIRNFYRCLYTGKYGKRYEEYEKYVETLRGALFENFPVRRSITGISRVVCKLPLVFFLLVHEFVIPVKSLITN